MIPERKVYHHIERLGMNLVKPVIYNDLLSWFNGSWNYLPNINNNIMLSLNSNYYAVA